MLRMFRMKEWTLIEWMIVLSIVGIFLVTILAGLASKQHEKTQCIGGYLFTNPIRYDYTHPVTPIQVLDEHGRGIRCEDK